MNSEKNDLYELCENIVLNDNLNEDSIREIAEYINNTPNASDCWPAKILIDPLKKVWEDGKVDRSEIDSLQNTLEMIVNETKQTETQDEKLNEDAGVEDLIDYNRSTPDQIAALESIGYLKDNSDQQKTDAERARGGCGFVIALTVIVMAILSGNIFIIIGVLGFAVFVYLIVKIKSVTGGGGGGWGGCGGSGCGGCGGGCGGCGGGD